MRDGRASARPSRSAPRTATDVASTRRSTEWFSWVFGAAILVGVVILGIHHSDEREFLRLIHRAEPWWLAVAAALQVLTYLAEGEIWRVVIRSAGERVPASTAYKLSVAKLFIDQVIPSGGISGTLVFARALERRGVERGVVTAAVVVGTVSYHAVYVASLGLALAILTIEGRATRLIILVSAVFSALALALAAAAMALSGKQRGTRFERLEKIPMIEHALELLRDADTRLVHNLRVMIEASLYQFAIVVLDAATLWFLIRSLGAMASPAGVFASFVISSLIRTVGIVPGGLGTFEAASVVTLRMANVSVAVALAATLLFRGLSFWLPLVPGLLLSKHAVAGGDPTPVR